MTTRLSLFVAFSLGCAFTGRAQDLVRVPAATYEVSDQITTLKVQVSVSEFLLGAAEVTQKEYEAITSSNPSVYKGADRPVENVSWWDAIRYCNLRSAKEGLTACYDLTSGERDPACTGYRLPTEAEWIVAAGPLPRDRELLEAANLGVSSTKSLDVFEPAIKKGTAHVRSLKASESGFFDLRAIPPARSSSPPSIHFLINSICGAPSGSPCGGMNGSADRVTEAKSRLSPGAPAARTSPDDPPAMAAAKDVRSSPLFFLSGL